MFRDTAAQDRALDTPPLWKRHWRWLAAGGVALLLAAWLIPALLRLSGVTHSVSVQRLSIATVTRGRFVRDIAADGKVVAAVSPTIYASAAGSLSLRVQAGDAVQKGQVLGVLDSPELTARLGQEQASLDSLHLDWQRSELGAQRAQQQAQLAFDQAQVDQQTAQRELERSRKAYEQGAYSQLQMLRAEDTLTKANFSLSQAREALAEQPAQNRFDVDSKKALLDRQQVIVADLQRQVDALQLRAPVDGQVGQLLVADRATVARDTPLLTVIDLSALEVEIQVPEGFARDLATGMPAELSGNGGQWQGTVSAVSPEVVAGQVTARVRFGDDKPAGLRQNQRLSVRIVIDQRDNVLMVDRGSFVDESGGAWAWVLRDGVAVKTPIHIGALSIGKVEITEGLHEGDQVVVSGTDAFAGAERVAISR